MTTISLPMWVLATGVGLPSICLFWLVLSLVRRKHQTRREFVEPKYAALWPGQQLAVDQFQQNLMEMQIDAVFDGLTALIESERVKLKSLMSIPPASGTRAGQAFEPNANLNAAAASRRFEQDVPATDHGISSSAENRAHADVITSLSGLSRVEMELAGKMKASRASNAGRKLEAVA